MRENRMTSRPVLPRPVSETDQTETRAASRKNFSRDWNDRNNRMVARLVARGMGTEPYAFKTLFNIRAGKTGFQKPLKDKDITALQKRISDRILAEGDGGRTKVTFVQARRIAVAAIAEFMEEQLSE